MNKNQIYVEKNPKIFIAENIFNDFTDTSAINPIGIYSITGKNQLPYSMLGEYPEISPYVYYFRREPSTSQNFEIDHFAIGYNENENKFYWFFSGEFENDYTKKTQVFATGINLEDKEDIYLPTGWSLFSENTKNDFFINDKFYQKNIFLEGSADLTYKITGDIDITYSNSWDELSSFESAAGWLVNIEDDSDLYSYYVKLNNQFTFNYSDYIQSSNNKQFYISETFIDDELYGNIADFDFVTEKTIEFKKGPYVEGQSFSNRDYLMPTEILELAESIPLSPSKTPTPTATPTITPTISASITVTPTISKSPSVTPSISVTPSPTKTPGLSASVTPTVTKTPSVTPFPKNVVSLRSLHIKGDDSDPIKVVGLDIPTSEAEITWPDIDSIESRDNYKNFIVNFFEEFNVNSLSLGKEFSTISIKTKKIEDFPYVATNVLNNKVADGILKINYVNDFFSNENYIPKRIDVNINTWDGNYIAVNYKDSERFAETLRLAADNDGVFTSIQESNGAANFNINRSLITTQISVDEIVHNYPDIKRIFLKVNENNEYKGLEEITVDEGQSCYVLPMIIHEEQTIVTSQAKIKSFYLSQRNANGSFDLVGNEKFTIRNEGQSDEYYINEPAGGGGNLNELQVILFDNESNRWERVFPNPNINFDRYFTEGSKPEDLVSKPSVRVGIASATASPFLDQAAIYSNYQISDVEISTKTNTTTRDLYRFEIILLKNGLTQEYQGSATSYLSAADLANMAVNWSPQDSFGGSLDSASNNLTDGYDLASRYNIFKNFLYHEQYRSYRDHPFTVEIVEYDNLYPVPSRTPTVTPSNSVSNTVTPTNSSTPSVSPTNTPDASPSATPTPTCTPNRSPEATTTPTPTVTPSVSVSRTVTPSLTKTPSPSRTPNVATTFIELDFGDPDWFDAEEYELIEENVQAAWKNQNNLFGTENTPISDSVLNELKKEYLLLEEGEHVKGMFPTSATALGWSFYSSLFQRTSNNLEVFQNSSIFNRDSDAVPAFARKYIGQILKYSGWPSNLFNGLNYTDWLPNYFNQYMKYSDFLNIENTIKNQGSAYYSTAFTKFKFFSNRNFAEEFESNDSIKKLINHSSINADGVPNYHRTFAKDVQIGRDTNFKPVFYFNYIVGAGLKSTSWFWDIESIKKMAKNSNTGISGMKGLPETSFSYRPTNLNIGETSTFYQLNSLTNISRTNNKATGQLMLGVSSSNDRPVAWIRKIYVEPIKNLDLRRISLNNDDRIYNNPPYIFIEWALHYTRNGKYIGPPIMRRFYNLHETFEYRNVKWSVVSYPPFLDFGMAPVRRQKVIVKEVVNAPLANPIDKSLDSPTNVENEYSLPQLLTLAKSTSTYNNLDFGKYHEMLKFKLELGSSSNLRGQILLDSSYDPNKGHAQKDFTVMDGVSFINGTYVKADFETIGAFGRRGSVPYSSKYYWINPNDYYWYGSGLVEFTRYNRQPLLPKVLQAKVFGISAQFGKIQTSRFTGYFTEKNRNFPAILFQVDTSRPIYVKQGSMWTDNNLYQGWSYSKRNQKFKDYTISSGKWDKSTEIIIAYCNAYDNDGTSGLQDIENSGWFLFVMHAEVARNYNTHYSWADCLDMSIISFERIGLSYNNSLSSLIKNTKEDLLNADEIAAAINNDSDRNWFYNYYGRENLIIQSFSKAKKRELSQRNHIISNEPESIDFSNITIGENSPKSLEWLLILKNNVQSKDFKIDINYKKRYFNEGIGYSAAENNENDTNSDLILEDDGSTKQGYRSIALAFNINNSYFDKKHDYTNGQYFWNGGTIHQKYPVYKRYLNIYNEIRVPERNVKFSARYFDVDYVSQGITFTKPQSEDNLLSSDNLFKGLESYIEIKFYPTYRYGVTVYENVWVITDSDFGMKNTVYTGNLDANKRDFVFKNENGLIGETVDYKIPKKINQGGVGCDFFELSDEPYYNGAPIYYGYKNKYNPLTSETIGKTHVSKLIWENEKWQELYIATPTDKEYDGRYVRTYYKYFGDTVIRKGMAFDLRYKFRNVVKKLSIGENMPMFVLLDHFNLFNNIEFTFPEIQFAASTFTVVKDSEKRALMKYHTSTEIDETKQTDDL